MRIDSFMGAEFDILSYMASMYGLHDEYVPIRVRCSDRKIGAQRNLAGRESAANCFIIGKICGIPDESGMSDGTAFTLFSTWLAVRSAPDF